MRLVPCLVALLVVAAVGASAASSAQTTLCSGSSPIPGSGWGTSRGQGTASCT